jgi:uncharacterized membrane protein
MLNWILNLIPADYKWSVAAKNIAYDCGKGIAMLLTYGKVGHYVGSHLTPDQLAQVQVGATALVGAGLAAFHDWAKVKWPNATWL